MLSSVHAAATIPRLVKRISSILRLVAVIFLASSCAAPKADLARKPNKKDSQGVQSGTANHAPEALTKDRNEEAPRVPDMLNQLPDERDFQPTNPSAAQDKSSGGTVVAKPPAATPP